MKNTFVSSFIALLAFSFVAAALPSLAAAQQSDSGLPPTPMRISQIETEQEAEAWLARTYRNERVVGSGMSLAFGTLATTIGMLEMLDATNIYDGQDDQVIGALLIGSGAGAIGVGTVGLTGPFSDSEVHAFELATAETPDVDEMRAFIRRRAEVAQRERWIGSITSITAGAGFLIAGALYDQEDDNLDPFVVEQNKSDTTRYVFYAVGGVFVATGLTVAFVSSPEERFARQFGLGDYAETPRNQTSFRLAPLVTRVDDRSYGGLSLTVR